MLRLGLVSRSLGKLAFYLPGYRCPKILPTHIGPLSCSGVLFGGVAAADANHTNRFNIMLCVSHSSTGYISKLLLGMHFNCRGVHPKSYEILRMVDSLFSNFHLVPVSIKSVQ